VLTVSLLFCIAPVSGSKHEIRVIVVVRKQLLDFDSGVAALAMVRVEAQANDDGSCSWLMELEV